MRKSTNTLIIHFHFSLFTYHIVLIVNSLMGMVVCYLYYYCFAKVIK